MGRGQQPTKFYRVPACSHARSKRDIVGCKSRVLALSHPSPSAGRELLPAAASLLEAEAKWGENVSRLSWEDAAKPLLQDEVLQ